MYTAGGDSYDDAIGWYDSGFPQDVPLYSNKKADGNLQIIVAVTDEGTTLNISTGKDG